MPLTTTCAASHHTPPPLLEELGESPQMSFPTPLVFDFLTCDFNELQALPRDIPGSPLRGQVGMTDIWSPTLPASCGLCLPGATSVQWLPTARQSQLKIKVCVTLICLQGLFFLIFHPHQLPRAMPHEP